MPIPLSGAAFTLAAASAAALAAIWIGYPLVMRALAATRRRTPPPSWPSPPSVSVVLATRESPAAVQARVDDLLATSYPAERIEVIVALDEARRDVADAAYGRDDPRVHVVRGDAGGGKAMNLNAGVRAATGEILVFADTAQRFDADAIPRLVAELARPGVAAVSGRLVLPPSRGAGRVYEWYWALEVGLREAEARLRSCIGVTGAIWAMPRARWRPLPAGLILDDVHTPMRLVLEGSRVAYLRTAVARDLRHAEPSQEERRKERTNTGVLQLCAWLPGLLVPWRNPSWAEFVLHKLLRLASPWLVLGMVPWVTISAIALARAYPRVALGAAVAGSSALLAGHLLTRGRLTKRLAGGLAAVAGAQVALVRATWNGVRGRWDVW